MRQAFYEEILISNERMDICCRKHCGGLYPGCAIQVDILSLNILFLKYSFNHMPNGGINSDIMTLKLVSLRYAVSGESSQIGTLESPFYLNRNL